MKKIFHALSGLLILVAFASCKQEPAGTLQATYGYESATGDAMLTFQDKEKTFQFSNETLTAIVSVEGTYTVSNNNVTLNIKNGTVMTATSATKVTSGSLKATMSDGGNKIAVSGKVGSESINVKLTAVALP